MQPNLKNLHDFLHDFMYGFFTGKPKGYYYKPIFKYPQFSKKNKSSRSYMKSFPLRRLNIIIHIGNTF